MKRGSVVKLAVGSHVAAYPRAMELGESVRIRKPRLATVEYETRAPDLTVFLRSGAKVYCAYLADVELVTTDDHSLSYTKFNRGGHPIAGWNWPLWGYRWKCACGEPMGEDDADDARVAHKHHLEEVSK